MEDFGAIFLFVLCWAIALIFAIIIAVEAKAIKLSSTVSWPRAIVDSWLMNVGSGCFLLVLGYLSATLLAQPYTVAKDQLRPCLYRIPKTNAAKNPMDIRLATSASTRTYLAYFHFTMNATIDTITSGATQNSEIIAA